ncbi:MAG: 3-phosphoglycerate dehydrogenase, partial [Elusimicrobia bacterium]|nr:3-phosphoglycerate dehydrogenase [Elusimicrobiota bacterium]
MYKIQTLNKISQKGLDLLSRDQYEVSADAKDPDAILVRSQAMHDMALAPSVKAIGRAGAGVNNIPVEKCAAQGVVVFNTPGANANAVKELVVAGLILASRKIVQGIVFAKSQADKGSELDKVIEKEKSRFSGPEIKGKKLGVIGLGAIGVMVANDALSLGMEVMGFDPYISIEAAWGLSREVKRARSLEQLIAESDYISLHVPLNDKTKGLIDNEKFALMKKGVRLVNFARGGLVDKAALKEACEGGTVAAYVTDFPDAALASLDQVVAMPHLGASTPESEDNCAVMAVRQVRDFLENGNIKNSVNYPDCEMPFLTKTRILIAN